MHSSLAQHAWHGLHTRPSSVPYELAVSYMPVKHGVCRTNEAAQTGNLMPQVIWATQPQHPTHTHATGAHLQALCTHSGVCAHPVLCTQSERNCTLVPFNTTIVLSVAFSVDPTEGISVMWDPTTANSTSLRGGALYIYSDIRVSVQA